MVDIIVVLGFEPLQLASEIGFSTIPYSLPAVTKTSPFAPMVYLRNFASAGR